METDKIRKMLDLFLKEEDDFAFLSSNIWLTHGADILVCSLLM